MRKLSNRALFNEPCFLPFLKMTIDRGRLTTDSICVRVITFLLLCAVLFRDSWPSPALLCYYCCWTFVWEDWFEFSIGYYYFCYCYYCDCATTNHRIARRNQSLLSPPLPLQPSTTICEPTTLLVKKRIQRPFALVKHLSTRTFVTPIRVYLVNTIDSFISYFSPTVHPSTNW